MVVVEADHGYDAGIIHAIYPPPAPISPYLPCPTASLRRIVCKASPEDRDLVQRNQVEEEHALQLSRHLAIVRRVPIIVAATEMQFDRKKLTIIFSSDRRVDFRELVRDMFQVFKTRIWMQKVSPSEAAALSDMFPTAPMPASRAPSLPQGRSSRPLLTPSIIDGHYSHLHTSQPPRGRGYPPMDPYPPTYAPSPYGNHSSPAPAQDILYHPYRQPSHHAAAVTGGGGGRGNRDMTHSHRLAYPPPPRPPPRGYTHTPTDDMTPLSVSRPDQLDYAQHETPPHLTNLSLSAESTSWYPSRSSPSVGESSPPMGGGGGRSCEIPHDRGKLDAYKPTSYQPYTFE